MKAGKAEIPFKWPFPPRPKSKARNHGRLPAGASQGGRLSPKAMATDVIMVLVWGATIPGLMWLGAAGGF